MILIGKTANCLLGAYVIAHSAVLKAVDESVCMREFTRSIKTTYCSRSRRRRFTVLNFKGWDLVAFTATFSNICTAHAQKGLFMNFLCKFRHHRSTRRPWPLTFWPYQLSYMAGHVTNLAIKYEDPTPIRSWVTSYKVSHWLPLKMRTRPLRISYTS